MRIGVLMGGMSSERMISIKTGKAMAEALKGLDYEVVECLVNDREDIFKLPDIDFALLAFHGKFGEDGMVQNYLELKDIPYSGCNGLTSGMCMDKNITKRVVGSNGVPTARWVTVKSVDKCDISKVESLNLPVFVKPNSGGSSVATFKVKSYEELIPAITEALKWDREVMIEEFMPGYEITCAMLDRRVLPIIKIDAKGEFFDISSKYNKGGADEYAITLDSDKHDRIVDICKKTWDALGCSVYCRVDIIVNGDDMKVLEVNTLPGFTGASLFPKSAIASGLSMSELVDNIIGLSLEERIREKKKRISVQEMESAHGLSSR